MARVLLATICSLLALTGCSETDPQRGTGQVADNEQTIGHEEQATAAKEETATLREGMLLDEAMEMLLAAEIAPREEHLAMDVKGSAEWKLFHLGNRGADSFYLLASRTEDESQLRVKSMYWWLNAEADGKLPKALRENNEEEVSSLTVRDLVKAFKADAAKRGEAGFETHSILSSTQAIKQIGILQLGAGMSR